MMTPAMAHDDPAVSPLFGKTLAALSKCAKAQLSAAQLRITFDQYVLLAALSDHEALTQSELADLLGRDKSAVLRQIDYLEEEGFVTRVADPDDRRKKTLVLTRSGLQVHAKARALVESIMSEALHGIPSHDMRTFTRVLARMQEALNSR
jgi:DNA-binding MarR family transcriptional regulator